MTDTTVVPMKPQRGKPLGRAPKARKAAYESAGPAQLVMQPSTVSGNPLKPNEVQSWRILYQHMQSRLNMMRAWRFSWMEHYQLLETYLLPRRGIFVNASQPTPNTMIRGVPINQNIVDPTGTYAMRRCAAGMMSGLMSPSRPWFKLKPAMFGREVLDAAGQDWFEDVEDRMYQVMARSNIYDATAQQYEDLVAFGTGPMIIYEDDRDILRCYVPCPGEYFIASSSAMRVEPCYRLFVMTVSQIVEMFDVENCPPEIQQLWREKGGSLEMERIVAHAIEPNFEVKNSTFGAAGVVPGNFTWREAYWVYGAASDWPLSLRGFSDQPHVVPRWAVTSNDAYGRSVGMDVLPDIIQLQVETERKAEALEKMVRPPMLASMEMKNEPSSILPGRVTYVASLDSGKGMRPAFTVTPQIREMAEDIAAVQQRIREGFFNDLFAMLESVKKDMTAYEVAARNQEKLQILGPVIERLQNEDLAPKIKRVYAIMLRKGLLPPVPPSLKGVPLGIEYVGMLTLAQKAASTTSLERFAATMGNMQAGDPSVANYWDRAEWVREYADDLFLPKRILNSPDKVAALEKAQQEAQQQVQAAQMAQVAVDGAHTLSQTQVGGGANALAMMLGNTGGQAGAA